MTLTNSLVVLFIAVLLQIFDETFQQCFLFFIVVVIPGHNLGNSQVSVNMTIGPPLVWYLPCQHFSAFTTGIYRLHITCPNPEAK